MILTIMILSIVLNIFLLWYGKTMLERLLFVSDSMADLLLRLKEFDEHLKILWDIDMFYGDETLKNLIRHSRSLGTYLTRFNKIYTLSGDDDEDIFDEIEEEYEDGYEEESDSEAKTASPTGKVIFHSGT